MKLFLYIFKRAFQAGAAMTLVILLFIFIGFEVASIGLPFSYNLIIMLFTLLGFIFFGIIGAFAYFEYKEEFKTKTNEQN